jgi:hypothetical protein
MQDDPILNEIRRIRRTIDEECGDNGQKFFECLVQMQKKYTDRLICRSPRPRLKSKERKT